MKLLTDLYPLGIMDNPDDCVILDRDDSLEADDYEGFKSDLYEIMEPAEALSDYEDRVTRQALEAPTALVTSDLFPRGPQPQDAQPQDDTRPRPPIHEQTAWDEDGVEVGTILPTVSITLVNQISVDIPQSTLVMPRSLYRGEAGEEPRAEPAREWTAVQSLLKEYRRIHSSDTGDIEFDLDQFAVYIDATVPGDKHLTKRRYPCEMRPLQYLGRSTESGRKEILRMYVDGILSVGDKKFSIRGVPFEQLPIGNYGSSEPTVGSEIWIRSCLNVAIARDQETNVYYRLKSPSVEYERYYDGFLWVADLAKHVVDYLSKALEERRQVVFRDFRSAFNTWLMQTHGNSESEAFYRWRDQYQRTDFCNAMSTNVEFIYMEAFGVLGHRVDSIYLWKEIFLSTAYLDSNTKTPPSPANTAPSASPPSTLRKREPSHIPKTVVTPYVNQLFNHLPCGKMIEALELSPETERLRRDATNALRLDPSLNIHTSAKNTDKSPETFVNVGDVISTTRDEGGNWARETPAGFNDVDRWFGIVQKVHRRNDGKKSFDIIWIYRPVDTICGNMRYPWENELFISDHCSCNNSSNEKIKEEEVLATHKVDWGGLGFDPAKSFPKLRGFDLFCGGGNFGRGLEEGGAIEMNWANDINVQAIHTYMANAENTVHPFAGSIDDLQRLALQGKFSKKVPPIGSVDFVSGGSPCPGFSQLTVNKDDLKQRKNQSLVAAFASFIDVYRPKFGLLENVMEIVQSKAKRNEDVLSQLICAVVGLGYQAHFFIMDSWTYGSPQSRSRVFFCFAAPGLKLPEIPMQSHSHYESGKRRKTLGRLPNGEPMVERLNMPTPFKFVSIAEAIADLPDIMDGKADCCVDFPDHRIACSITKRTRAQLSVIPMHPQGMNFRRTWDNGKGTMTAAERGLFPSTGNRVVSSTSRAWGRLVPHSVMRTVTTTASPSDARMGSIMHWSQNRVFSVMEARRAQGFLDHEVILGQPKAQWKVVGNSVAREVSLALGLSFREAWLGSLIDGEEVQPTVGVPQQSAQAEAEAAASRDLDSDEDMAGTCTSLSTDSRGETPVLASPRHKRKFGSSFVIELVVRKLKKARPEQMAPERLEDEGSAEDDGFVEVASVSSSSKSISSCKVIELD
ncbi:C-5 cytosine-specific DNA methylase [Colletotrichum caudatum]|nr:C-5 cytosine-specific DNA methylase [Colletotrichum caudatum]